MPRARGDYAPPPLRNRPYEIGCARHNSNAISISRFERFEFPNLGYGIQMRRHALNDFNRTHSMCNRNDLLLVNSFQSRPGAPLPVHRTGGIDEDSVQIKKNCRAMKDWHCSFCTTGRSPEDERPGARGPGIAGRACPERSRRDAGATVLGLIRARRKLRLILQSRDGLLRLLPHQQVPLPEVRLGAPAPGPHEPVVQGRADGGAQ